MKPDKVWRRKQLIVAPRFQMNIVAKSVVLTALVTGLFTWSVFYLVWKYSLDTGNVSLITMLFESKLWIGLGLCMLTSLALSTALLLKVTHRIAGQMYRFEKVLDQTICGDTVRPVITRKDDYFHDFEVEMNRFLNREN
ncbi:hypothetical protein KKA00_05610 [bacterium]|nr:hypothetical protein [bacterium]MBU1651674.1 hypothetical protein [bacterium]MBU1881781.1 hypothetical protein [bacterium]